MYYPASSTITNLTSTTFTGTNIYCSSISGSSAPFTNITGSNYIIAGRTIVRPLFVATNTTAENAMFGVMTG